MSNSISEKMVSCESEILASIQRPEISKPKTRMKSKRRKSPKRKPVVFGMFNRALPSMSNSSEESGVQQFDDRTQVMIPDQACLEGMSSNHDKRTLDTDESK